MARGTSSTVLEEELVKGMKSEKPWYSRCAFAYSALIILASIDVAGFAQGILFNLPDLSQVAFWEEITTIVAMVVMVFGFIASFEFATLYMAYAFSLKLYHYDRYAIKRINRGDKNVRLSKFISTTSLGWISFAVFVMGVIANIIFRLGTFGDELSSKYNLALTIVMIILPVITSGLNFVIGCFNFDPILFELEHLAKELGKTSIDIGCLEVEKERINQEIQEIEQVKISQESLYKSEIVRIISMKPALRIRGYEDAMKNI